MQTFLPYPSFKQSVQCLDWRRLGKQRIEAWQLIKVISPNYKPCGKRSWAHHPAAKMWHGYRNALRYYMNLCILEWIRRGYNNSMKIACVEFPIIYPPWFGNENFHAAHRSNLLRKNPNWYNQFGWIEPDNLPYIWPV